jgi:hypothetical protein
MFGKATEESAEAPQPAARADLRAQIVAHVDDIEPARSSPEIRRVPGDGGRGSKPSLFNLWRGRRTEPARADARPTVSPTLIVGSTPRSAASRQREETSERSAARPAQLREVAEPRSKEEDLLEIPAFLRRQAN